MHIVIKIMLGCYSWLPDHCVVERLLERIHPAALRNCKCKFPGLPKPLYNKPLNRIITSFLPEEYILEGAAPSFVSLCKCNLILTV